MQNETQQNPFLRADQEIESLRLTEPAARKTVKKAELTVRALEQHEAELLRPNRISDRVFETETLPPYERWKRVSESLGDKMEKLSVRMDSKDLSDAEKDAAWTRFKNMALYKEKIDKELKEKRISDKTSRELEDDPLHAYAQNRTPLEDEVVKQNEAQAAKLSDLRKKLSQEVKNYRSAETRVQELEKPFTPEELAKREKQLDWKVEKTAEIIEHINENKKILKRMKNWVDGDKEADDQTSLEALPIETCVKMYIAADKEYAKFLANRKKDDEKNEEKKLQGMRLLAKRDALHKRLSKPDIKALQSLDRKDRDLIFDKKIHLGQEELRLIDLVMLLNNNEAYLSDMAVEKNGYAFTEDEAKMWMSVGHYWFYDQYVPPLKKIGEAIRDFEFSNHRESEQHKALKKYTDRPWFKALLKYDDYLDSH